MFIAHGFRIKTLTLQFLELLLAYETVDETQHSSQRPTKISSPREIVLQQYFFVCFINVFIFQFIIINYNNNNKLFIMKLQ